MPAAWKLIKWIKIVLSYFNNIIAPYQRTFIRCLQILFLCKNMLSNNQIPQQAFHFDVFLSIKIYHSFKSVLCKEASYECAFEPFGTNRFNFGWQNLRRHMFCRAIKTKLIGGAAIALRSVFMFGYQGRTLQGHQHIHNRAFATLFSITSVTSHQCSCTLARVSSCVVPLGWRSTIKVSPSSSSQARCLRNWASH